MGTIVCKQRSRYVDMAQNLKCTYQDESKHEDQKKRDFVDARDEVCPGTQPVQCQDESQTNARNDKSKECHFTFEKQRMA